VVSDEYCVNSPALKKISIDTNEFQVFRRGSVKLG